MIFYFKQDIAGTQHHLKGDLLTALQELTTLVRQEHAKVALRARQVNESISSSIYRIPKPITIDFTDYSLLPNGLVSMLT
jgi:hypothetical protein